MPSSGGRVNIAMRGEVWCPSVEAEASPGPATATEARLEAAGGRGWPPPPWQQRWPLLSAGSCHCVVSGHQPLSCCLVSCGREIQKHFSFNNKFGGRIALHYDVVCHKLPQSSSRVSPEPRWGRGGGCVVSCCSGPGSRGRHGACDLLGTCQLRSGHSCQ